MGDAGDTSANKYSVPREAEKILCQKLLLDPRISKNLPPDLLRVATKVRFVGSDAPRLPLNWRVAESCSALHGLLATLVGVLLEKKYGVEAPEVVIDR